MKQERLISLILTIIIISMGIIFLVSPKKTYSSDENRYLKTNLTFTIKDLFNGNYIKDLETYLTDQFPYRQFFINVKTKYEKTTLKDESNNVYFGKNKYLIEKYNGVTNKTELVNIINNFYSKVNYQNMNLILIPSSIVINEDKLPNKSLKTKQLDDIKAIYDGVNINKIGITNSLLEHNEIVPIYYRLDHHWTTQGAYYAYEAYCLANNIKPQELKDITFNQVTADFQGTLYSKSGDYSRTKDVIYDVTIKPNYEVNYVYEKVIEKTIYASKYLTTKDKYAYFLDSNHALIVITNKDIKTDKELLVIKDSYANAMIPFLINHYKKIHIIDLRYYTEKVSDYIISNRKIKDTLILYGANIIGTDTGIITLR